MRHLELCVDVAGIHSGFEDYQLALEFYNNDLTLALEHGMAVTLWVLSHLRRGHRVYVEDIPSQESDEMVLMMFDRARIRQERFTNRDYDTGQLKVVFGAEPKNMIVGFTLTGRSIADFYQIMRCLKNRSEGNTVDTILFMALMQADATARQNRFIAAKRLNGIMKPIDQIPVWST